ncbi:hypothetical protein ABPG75_000886 [Micractinium tetrahymenae]
MDAENSQQVSRQGHHLDRRLRGKDSRAAADENAQLPALPRRSSRIEALAAQAHCNENPVTAAGPSLLPKKTPSRTSHHGPPPVAAAAGRGPRRWEADSDIDIFAYWGIMANFMTVKFSTAQEEANLQEQVQKLLAGLEDMPNHDAVAAIKARLSPDRLRCNGLGPGAVRSCNDLLEGTLDPATKRWLMKVVLDESESVSQVLYAGLAASLMGQCSSASVILKEVDPAVEAVEGKESPVLQDTARARKLASLQGEAAVGGATRMLVIYQGRKDVLGELGLEACAALGEAKSHLDEHNPTEARGGWFNNAQPLMAPVITLLETGASMLQAAMSRGLVRSGANLSIRLQDDLMRSMYSSCCMDRVSNLGSMHCRNSTTVERLMPLCETSCKLSLQLGLAAAPTKAFQNRLLSLRSPRLAELAPGILQHLDAASRRMTQRMYNSMTDCPTPADAAELDRAAPMQAGAAPDTAAASTGVRLLLMTAAEQAEHMLNWALADDTADIEALVVAAE